MRTLVVTLLLCVVVAAAILEVKLAAQQYWRLQREISAQMPHAG